MPFDLIAIAFDQILELAKEKGKRSEKILKALNTIGLKQDAPLDKGFDGVYAYTLVVYGIDKPKPILEFFRHEFIKNAFRKSFKQRDTSILEKETENFLDWSDIGKEVLAIDYDPKREFVDFSEQFILAAKLTRTVQEVRVEQKLDDIQNSIESLPDLEDFRQEIHPIAEGIRQLKLERSRNKNLVPFIIPQLDISSFTGRSKELKQLEKHLFQEGGTRIAGIVGISGIGGMGKSALAYHFAHKYMDRFPDGVIGLSIGNNPADIIAQRFAALAGADIEAIKDFSASQIMQLIFQNRRALLIFDNVEDIAFKTLRPGGNLCKVIVTTRNKGILHGLDIPDRAQIELKRFEYREAKELLGTLLGKERIKSEEGAVKEICQIVGGLPLALQIVGGALAHRTYLSITDYTTNLRKEKLELLKDVDDNKLNVRASFAMSLRFLTESQVQFLASISICALGGFSLDMVKAISQQPLEDVHEDLTCLIKLSLLNKANVDGRFVLHPLLHDFAAEIAKGLDLRESEERFLDYCIEFLNRHKYLSIANANAIENELENLLLAANRLLSYEVEYNYYSQLLLEFLIYRGYWDLALEILSSYIDHARKAKDYPMVISYLLQQGKVLQFTDRLGAAEKSYMEAQKEIIKIRKRRDRDQLTSKILNSLGELLLYQERLDEAINVYKQSYDLSMKIKRFLPSQAISLFSLGKAFLQRDRLDEAFDAFKHSYELALKNNDLPGQALTLEKLGNVLQRQDKFDDAVNALQLSLGIWRMLENDYYQAKTLNSLSSVLQQKGQFDDAVNVLQNSCDVFDELGDSINLAISLNMLGDMLLQQNKQNKAREAYTRSLTIWKEMGNERNQEVMLGKLDNLQKRQITDDAIQTTSDGELPSSHQRQLHKRQFPGATTTIKMGYIKAIYHETNGYTYGFITPFDGSPDIFFQERQVDPILIPKLERGLVVIAEIEKRNQGLKANRVYREQSEDE